MVSNRIKACNPVCPSLQPYVYPRRGELKLQWVQLASEEQVFLLDVPALCARHAEALQGTLGTLLAAPHVLKVGFGLRGDVKELRAAHPALAECAAAVSPVLELRDEWERARAADRGRPAEPDSTPNSSSDPYPYPHPHSDH